MTVPDRDFGDHVPLPAGERDIATKHDEADLVVRVRGGDAQAFAALVATYLEGVARFAYTIVGSVDAADDVAQTVFIHLWEHRASLDPARSLKPYLFRMVRNRALDERKANAVRERYRQVVQADIAADVGPGTAGNFAPDVLNAATMEAAMQRLSERRRLAIRLRFENQLTNAEIGEVLDITTRAAEMLVFRAVEDLRDILGSV